MKSAATTTGLKLDPETKARLQALGKARDRSPHWLMKRAVLEYLEREEISEQENRIYEERWQEYIRTGEHVTMEEMEAWFAAAISTSKRNAGEA